MHQDLGDHQGARLWTDRALEWAHIAGDPELTAYVLSRKAHLASDMGDGQSAREIADAAVRIAPNSRLESTARVYGAHGFALEGAATETDRAYDLAHAAAAKPKGDATRGRWLDGNYIEAQRGRSLVALGRYHAAVDVFETAIATLPHGYRRDQGVYLARQALAHAGNHDGDAAATAGIEALQIAQETHSGRIATSLLVCFPEVPRALLARSTIDSPPRCRRSRTRGVQLCARMSCSAWRCPSTAISTTPPTSDCCCPTRLISTVSTRSAPNLTRS
ncbi:putative DNA-binding protein [Pseudonocardia sp. Ae717_Ps2]|nr:putative DNA-binding protein [Pseudonocardia sp. Ae717_Ps2]